MPRRQLDIKSFFDIPLWKQIQDKLAELTGTAIMTVDYKGIPITKHSARTEFCSIIRDNPIAKKRCIRCDSLAGLEAVRLDHPYIYLCHCGIVDVSIPVLVGNHYLGAVICGQVRLSEEDNIAKIERIISEISFSDSDNIRQELITQYEKLKVMRYEELVQIADLLNAMVHYVIERGVIRHSERDAYQWLLKSTPYPQMFPQMEVKELRTFLDEDTLYQFPVSESSVVYPAVVYIHNHLQESISMKDMAGLCHVSPSYFSRIFTRDVGESFVNYTNRKKVELSKLSLRKTNKTVSQISNELGFQDVSHFISLFKKYEGVTPNVFRQYNYI